jgi:hypothetical protein
MAEARTSDMGRPLTGGWKLAIVAALVIALANSGIDSLRSREQQHHRNHEQRIDALENKIRELEANRDADKAKAPGKGE